MSNTLVVVVVNGYTYMIGSYTGLRAMLCAVVLACAGAAAGAIWVDAEAVYKEAKSKYPDKKPSLAKIPTGDTLVL